MLEKMKMKLSPLRDSKGDLVGGLVDIDSSGPALFKGDAPMVTDENGVAFSVEPDGRLKIILDSDTPVSLKGNDLFTDPDALFIQALNILDSPVLGADGNKENLCPPYGKSNG